MQELCTGRTLQDVISAQAPLKEEHAATLFRGVVKSVLHCHQVRTGARRGRACMRYYMYTSLKLCLGMIAL